MLTLLYFAKDINCIAIIFFYPPLDYRTTCRSFHGFGEPIRGIPFENAPVNSSISPDQMAAMGDIPPPTADHCREGRLGTAIILLCILYAFMRLRVKVVYGSLIRKFRLEGSRGPLYCLLQCYVRYSEYPLSRRDGNGMHLLNAVIWNYMVWYRIRGFMSTVP